MKHIFISYIREDQSIIDELRTFLDYHEILYWLDRKSLLPGNNWKLSIRKAIENGSLFFACFSNNCFSRESTYMNEELNLAIIREQRVKETIVKAVGQLKHFPECSNIKKLKSCMNTV